MSLLSLCSTYLATARLPGQRVKLVHLCDTTACRPTLSIAGFATARVSPRSAVSLLVTATALMAALSYVDGLALMDTLGQIRPASLLVVVTCLALGALASSYRLKLIARDVGYRITFRDAAAALSLGQVAGSLFFQIVGQLIARGAVLARRGVPAAGTIVVTGYERLAALLVSLSLALAGGCYLFGRITLDLQAGGAVFVKLAIGGALVLAAAAVAAWGRPAAARMRKSLGPRALHGLALNLAVSLLIQLMTMTAYIAAAMSLAPSIGFIEIAAAAAVVMLAASVPVSLAGWGVRELGAIYALGAIGMPSEAALAVAVLIGIVALAVVAALAAATGLAPSGAALPAARPAAADAPVDHAALLAWSVPVIAAMAVFFQVHIPLTTARLNVNLADPVAIVGGALFLLMCWRARALPAWRLPGLNAHIVAATAMLTIALALGWWRFGWTGWAFVNRFAGWFILLAYAATGAMIVRHAGLAGFRMLARTFAAAAAAIALLDLAIFSGVVANLHVPPELISYRSEGFAQNANAFALQLLLALACVVAAVEPSRLRALLLAGALIGLWFTGSRSGLIALGALLVAALWWRALLPRELLRAFAVTAAVVTVINWLPEIVATIRYEWALATGFLMDVWHGITGAGGGAGGAARLEVHRLDFSPFEVVASGYSGSNVQRIASLRGGWAMFEAHPILGGGLGAFVEQYARAHGQALVIHSTPLWLLAEMGAVGLLVFLAPFIRILKHEVHERPAGDAVRTFVILALLGFAVMAAVHDLFYQRALWLLLGAALALADSTPAMAKRAAAGRPAPEREPGRQSA